MGKHPKTHLLFYLFSGASNLFRSYTYLEIAVYVDIFVQIIYTKFQNVRAKVNEYTGCTKMENNVFLFPRRI